MLLSFIEYCKIRARVRVYLLLAQTSEFTINMMGVTVNALMRGYVPLSNPLYSFATMFGVSMPATFTDCQSVCNWLLSYAGSTGLQYFRCYSYGLSNGENMAGASYSSDYQSCSCKSLSCNRIRVHTCRSHHGWVQFTDNCMSCLTCL